MAALGRSDPLQAAHLLQRGDVLLDFARGDPDDHRHSGRSHMWLLKKQLQNLLLVGRQFFPDLFPDLFPDPVAIGLSRATPTRSTGDDLQVRC